MKKILFTLLLAALQTTVWAVPAKRGIWKNITLEDGTTVKVELRGDEFASYWQAADGLRFVKHADSEYYVLADMRQLELQVGEARAKAPLRSPSRVSIGGSHPAFVGAKKGLIILAEFADKKFQPEHTNAYYQRIANEEGFQDGNFVGSIRDYFKAQSEGQFDLTFDVVGPVQLKYNTAYYGAHSGSAHDKNPAAMIYEAVQAAAKLKPSFSEYDWFGDGYVDQIFVVYAGRGEADGGGDDTVWPHRSQFSYPYTLGGKKVQVYACSNEMRDDDLINGIGTFCHEFSHCLGLPDLYDTLYGNNYGMSYWDIMNSGCYLDESFRPCSYSGYERNYCGWKTPQVLTEDCEVKDLKGISEGGDYYIVYNDANKDEYYILENRNRTGWDAGQFGSGLLITHIDFNKNIWAANCVNTTTSTSMPNDHERYSVIKADNASVESVAGIAGDLYPYKNNTLLTNKSVPAATLFNPNPDGDLYMSKPITKITRNDDGTVSFVFKNEVGKSEETLPEGVVFRETFNDSYGQGGNDGLWSGVATEVFMADNEGWTSSYKYGADQCARFGTNTQRGIVTTPEISIDGEMVLSFLAGPWTKEASSLTLSVTSGSATIETTSFALTTGQWNECKTIISGSGKVKIQFRANQKRFFLDEVNVMTLDADAITAVSATSATGKTYNVMGQQVSPDTKGLIIRDGKKYVNK